MEDTRELLKAHVKGHTRTLKNGKVIQIPEYDTNVVKKLSSEEHYVEATKHFHPAGHTETLANVEDPEDGHAIADAAIHHWKVAKESALAEGHHSQAQTADGHMEWWKKQKGTLPESEKFKKKTGHYTHEDGVTKWNEGDVPEGATNLASLAQRTAIGENKNNGWYLRASSNDDAKAIAAAYKEVTGKELGKGPGDGPWGPKRAGATHHGNASAFPHIYFGQGDEAKALASKVHAALESEKAAPEETAKTEPEKKPQELPKEPEATPAPAQDEPKAQEAAAPKDEAQEPKQTVAPWSPSPGSAHDKGFEKKIAQEVQALKHAISLGQTLDEVIASAKQSYNSWGPSVWAKIKNDLEASLKAEPHPYVEKSVSTMKGSTTPSMKNMYGFISAQTIADHHDHPGAKEAFAHTKEASLDYIRAEEENTPEAHKHAAISHSKAALHHFSLAGNNGTHAEKLHEPAPSHLQPHHMAIAENHASLADYHSKMAEELAKKAEPAPEPPKTDEAPKPSGSHPLAGLQHGDKVPYGDKAHVEAHPEGLKSHTPFHKPFVHDVKDIGGKWSGADKTWTVPHENGEQLHGLMEKHFGAAGAKVGGAKEHQAEPQAVAEPKKKLAFHELDFDKGLAKHTKDGEHAPVHSHIMKGGNDLGQFSKEQLQSYIADAKKQAVIAIHKHKAGAPTKSNMSWEGIAQTWAGAAKKAMAALQAKG